MAASCLDRSKSKVYHSKPRLGRGGFGSLVVLLACTLTGSQAVAQAVTSCGFPDLTVQEVATVTSLTGTYIGVCWLGRILLRMMT